jgi:hypothetical protein
MFRLRPTLFRAQLVPPGGTKYLPKTSFEKFHEMILRGQVEQDRRLLAARLHEHHCDMLLCKSKGVSVPKWQGQKPPKMWLNIFAAVQRLKPSEASLQLETAEKMLARVKKDLATAKRDTDLAKKDLETAKREADRAKKDLETAKRDADRPFKSVEEAVLWLDIAKKPTYVSSNALSREFGPIDVDRLLKSITNSARLLQPQRGPTKADKMKIPLPCVIGASGQGKTEVLHWLRTDGVAFRNTTKRWVLDLKSNSAFSRIPTLITPPRNEIFKKLAAMFGATHVTAVFASFNQTTNFNAILETCQGGLVSRWLCDWYQRRWTETFSQRCSRLTLHDVDHHIRSHAAKTLHIKADKLLVIYLADELRKMTPSWRSHLLNGITGLMQTNWDEGHPTFPVVSCLDVGTIFATVTQGSQRPLTGIRLMPCPQEVVDQLAKRCQTDLVSAAREIELLNIRFLTLAAGGHFRTLCEILEHAREGRTYNFKPWPSPEFARAALQLFKKLWWSPSMMWSEKTYFASMTLYQLTTQGFGIFYKKVDEGKNLVQPAIAPGNMLAWGWGESTDETKHIQHLLRSIATLVRNGVRSISKEWETLLPLAVMFLASVVDANDLRQLVGGSLAQKPWQCKTPETLNFNKSALRATLQTHTKWPCQSLKAQTAQMRRVVSSPMSSGSSALLACPTQETYRAIDGALINAIQVNGMPCTILFQMKYYSGNYKVPKWFAAMHSHAKLLGLTPGSYYAVLFVSGIDAKASLTTEPGSVLIGSEGLVKILDPLGLTPVLNKLSK